MSLIRAKEASLFKKYDKYVKGKILDVGCGDGEFTKMVWGKIEAGIDIKSSRMQECGETYKELKEFDGIKIPYKNGYFKTTVSNCVLEHVSHLEKLLKEINRVVQPGGYFLTTVMAKPWEDNLLGSRWFGRNYKKWFRHAQEHVNLLAEKEWNQVFKQTGWRIVEEVGYLPPKAGHQVEIWHFLSIGYLISYKITGKWTWFNPAGLLPITQLAKVMEENTRPDKSGAIFYVLEKIKA